MKNNLLKVALEEKGERLDKFILKSQKNFSRSFIQKLIEENQILVNDKTTKAGYKLRVNDEIKINIPDLKEVDITPEEIPLDIVFEDKDLIVINKYQGMITHPASGVYSGTLVNALLHHCKKSLSGINGVMRPGIVHRLDKDTSGLIVVCKNDKSHNFIAKQLKDRTCKRSYYAIVYGNLKYDSGTINQPIGRHKINRKKMAIVSNGKEAITKWSVLKRLKEYTLIECNLETGRTHQIRVHLASLNHPIVGDVVYGKKKDKFPMMLHAYRLTFIHPSTKKEIKLETKIPKRFTDFINEN